MTWISRTNPRHVFRRQWLWRSAIPVVWSLGSTCTYLAVRTDAWIPWMQPRRCLTVTANPRHLPVPCQGIVHRQLFSSLQQQTPTEQEMTVHALEIVHAAIQAVDPVQAIKSHLQLLGDTTIKIGENDSLDLKDYDELLVIAFGKASSAMATTVLQQMDGRLKSSGIIICKDDHASQQELEFLTSHGIQVQMASHPVPDHRSVQGAALLMDLVRARRSPRTLVVCCISGGGSALFCLPAPSISLDDLQTANSVLLASGMGIQDMNVIRKRLEQGKGGRLAAECYPSQLVTLVLSDVLGDPLDLIASGPTVPDSSSWMDAWNIVKQYGLEDALPQTVVNLMKSAVDNNLPDSPPLSHPIFETSKTVLVGNNALAVQAAAEHAKHLGYYPVIIGTQIEGEAKQVPHVYASMALFLQQQQQQQTQPSPFLIAPSLPAALIAGGETTVTLPPDNQGKGGRNQELALSAGLILEKMNLRNVVIASAGTDGTDGPTDAAGAVVDASTLRHDLEGARDALRTHSAYTFFTQLGREMESHKGPVPLIKTGPTGTNVADICVTLVGTAP